MTVHIVAPVLFTLPAALMFVSLGLLCGSIFTDKQVGGAFQKIANLLPFVHAVEMERAVLGGDYAGVFPHKR